MRPFGSFELCSDVLLAAVFEVPKQAPGLEAVRRCLGLWRAGTGSSGVCMGTRHGVNTAQEKEGGEGGGTGAAFHHLP